MSEMTIDGSKKQEAIVVETSQVQQANTTSLDISGSRAIAKAQVRRITAEDLKHLPQESQREIIEFYPKIMIEDENVVRNYASSVQKRIADDCKAIMKSVEKSPAELMVRETLLKLINSAEEINKEKKIGLFQRLLGGVSNAFKRYEEMRERFQTTLELVNGIEKELEDLKKGLIDSQTKIIRSVESSIESINANEMYIIAGRLALNEVRENRIPVLEQEAAESGLYEKQYELQRLKEAATSFEKKLNNIELSRELAINNTGLNAISKYTSKQLLDEVETQLSYTIPSLHQICMAALFQAENEIASENLRDIRELTQKMCDETTRDVCATAIKVAENSKLGYLDPQVLIEMRNTITETGKKLIELREADTQSLKESIEELKKTEAEILRTIPQDVNKLSNSNNAKLVI